MSAARFKSNDDYFSKRSGLARRVIEKKPQKRQKKSLDTPIPVSIMIDIFCRTVDFFEIKGKGRFETGEYSLDETLIQHLAGGETVKINPLSRSGEAVWNVVHFALSGKMDHPFTKAKQYSEKLLTYGIKSFIEVAGGGKGDYHLWIFHKEPVDGRAVAEALSRLGLKLFGIDPEMAPPMEGDTYIPLPLHGESVLFQRCVFVNSVGKMIRNQRSFLLNIERNSGEVVEQLLEKMLVESRKTPVAGKKMAGLPEKAVGGAEPSAASIELPSEKTSPQKDKAGDRAVNTTDIPKKTVQTEKKPEKKLDGERPVLSQVILFTVNGKVYGIDAGVVDSVMMSDDMSAIPATETHVIGTVQSGDRILPVIDAGFLFEGGKKSYSPGRRILVLKGKSECSGLLVDGISGIRNVLSGGEKLPAKADPMHELASRSVVIGGYNERIPCIDHEKIFVYSKAEKTDTESPGAEKDIRCVVFRTGNVFYGFPADSVHEILVLSDVHSLKSSNGLSQGAVRYGKTYIPLIDIREGSGTQADMGLNGEKSGRLLVISGKESLAGVIVDSVEGIRTFPRDAITPAPAGIRQKMLVGSFARESDSDSVVLVYDPLRFVEKHG